MTLLLWGPAQAHASLKVDTSFGVNGVWSAEGVYGPLIECDRRGRILVAERIGWLTRLTAKGQTDRKFGRSDWEYSVPLFSPFNDVDYPVSLSFRRGVQPLVGYNSSVHYTSDAIGFGVEAFTEDGKRDDRFFEDGVYRARVHGSNAYRTVADVIPKARGRTLMTGTTLDSRIWVRKIDRDGKLIRSYGRGGHFLSGAGDGVAEAQDAEQLPGGDLLVLGYVDDRLKLFRLDRNGKLRRGFGNGGVTTFAEKAEFRCPQGGCSADDQIVVTSGGRIIVADQDGNLFAANSSGDVVRDFGGDGRVEVRRMSPKKQFWLSAMKLDGNRIVLGGTTGRSRQAGMLVGMLPSGRLDRSFAGKGWSPVTAGGLTRLSSLEVTGDGYLVGGLSDAPDENDPYDYLDQFPDSINYVIKLERPGS